MAVTEPPNIDDNTTPDAEAAELSRRERAALEKTNKGLELENTMLRVGIDPGKGLGKLFRNGYDGDVNEDAIRTAAIEAGVLQAEAPEPPPVPEPDVTDDERTQTRDRQTAAGGVHADGGTVEDNPDPRVVAIRSGEAVIAAGGTTESAMTEAFDTIAAAGYGGDKRAQWFPGKEDPRRPDLGW